MICFTLAVLFLGLKYYFAFLTASARVIGNFSPEFGFPLGESPITVESVFMHQ